MKNNLKKTKEYKKDVCLSPEHNPPAHKVYEAGEYEYTCPSCGKITKFKKPLVV
jgi:hypothetical protein